MSKFKEKLNKLFIQEFGEDALKDCFYFKKNNYIQTDYTPKSSIINYNNFSKFSNSYNTIDSLNFSKKIDSSLDISRKKIINKIMNKSALSPIYYDKDSFYFLINNNGLNKLREISRNKYKSHLKKEIDGLTDIFKKEKLSSKYRYNRPIKLNYSHNYNINYLTTLSNLKINKTKEKNLNKNF